MRWLRKSIKEDTAYNWIPYRRALLVWQNKLCWLVLSFFLLPLDDLLQLIRQSR